MVARRLSRHAILQTNAQNIVGLELLNISRHHRIGNIFHRFALPIWQSFQNGRLVFRRNAIRVLWTCAEFIDIAHVPAAALEIGMQIRTTIGIRWRTHNKLVIENHAAHVFKNMIDNLRAENGHRITRKLLVSLRLQHQMLGRNTRRRAEMAFPHAIDTWRTHSIPPYNEKGGLGRNAASRRSRTRNVSFDSTPRSRDSATGIPRRPKAPHTNPCGPFGFRPSPSRQAGSAYHRD